MKAWILDTNESVTLEDLAALGVLYWHVPADTHEQDGILDKICKDQHYDYREVHITPATIPNYEEKIKMFFEEHIHKDDEIRYFLGGSGYFDVRDKQDRWVRIHCEKSDMIVLPAGIYHRYTNDEKNDAKVMRLFQGVPVWTPYNRSSEVDKFQERQTYAEKYLKA